MRDGRTVSIALATYNGARYLPKQLDSYLAQTRLPDELVVGDDASSDATVEIIAAFAQRAPFPVSVAVNRPGLGPADNFAATIARCSGQVVLLSDQDDIWLPDKTAALLEHMAERPDRLLVTHDAALVDADGTPTGLTMGGQLARSGARPERGLVAGCCMAIDRRLAALFDPRPATRTHDAWIDSLAVLLDLKSYLPRPLIHYRRHGANVSHSFMSAARPASPWARWRDRMGKAAAEPAPVSLDWAVRGRHSTRAALERCRTTLADVVPAERIAAALADLDRAQARDLRRLAIHHAPLRLRPRRIAACLGSGDYAGTQGALSLLRDLRDAWR